MKMPLIGRHPEPLTAAMSLAENRASKCELLRASAAKADAAGEDYGDQLRRIADRSARRLFDDVRAFVAFEYAQRAHGEQVPDNVCEQLHAAVARARGFYPGPWAVPAPTDLGVIHGPFRDFPVDTL